MRDAISICWKNWTFYTQVYIVDMFVPEAALRDKQVIGRMPTWLPEHIRYLFIVSHQATKKSTNRIKKHDRRLNGSNCLYGDEDTLGDLWWTFHQSIHAKFISHQPQRLLFLPWPTCPLSSHSSPPKDIRQRDEVTSSQFRVRLFLPSSPSPFCPDKLLNILVQTVKVITECSVVRNVSVVLWVFITLVGTERGIPTLPFDTGPQASLPPNLRTNLLGRLPALYA